ncbi:hypothetical protein [Apibacter sp. B2912]|uniref:hypothetical protein n=1 Tax=Apibacter sp. B2912 TaxID=2656763 RepID=UPI00136E129F|nr:hypothetical protein [Apibacter sp. B2912]MXO32493.1 hypothetical protein [Apibacter sp. B2912]
MSIESPVYNTLALTIKKAIPTLEKDGKIFAHQIIAISESGKSYIIKERRGIPIQNYIGKKVHCVIEILDAEFYTPTNKKEREALPSNTMKGIYLWKETGYKFIPELVKLVDGDPNEIDHDYDENEYDKQAPAYFEEWGEYGLGLDIYQTKPMLKIGNGVCFLNEYCQEEMIDEWKYGQEVFFSPKEMLLRGIHTGEVKIDSNKIDKEVSKSYNEKNDYKIYEGKKYTKEEWIIKEKEIWKEYAKKNNIYLDDSNEKENNKPSGSFLFD